MKITGILAPSGRGDSRRLAFTLIELILVMAILTMAVALTAPSLANFFRGRSLDSEARRLLALIHQGQSRAVSEGIPMELWVDAQQHKVGLEAEPSFETSDPRAVEYPLETEVQMQAPNSGAVRTATSTLTPSGGMTGASTAPSVSNHPTLPRIRFLPDGYISETSPQVLRVAARDGGVLYLVQSTNRLNYEIRARIN